MKPIIGITMNYIKEDEFFIKQGVGTKRQEWHALPSDYTNAIIKAGGIPILIPCTDDLDTTKEILDGVDGVLMSGGNDIDPIIFGKKSDSKTGIVSVERDMQDLFTAEYIIKETNKPFLGVCRGMQVLNVALGGDLHVDLVNAGYDYHSINNTERYQPTHKIEIDQNSILFDVFKSTITYINSYHHQAIDRVADGLKIIAVSEDGVIEAVESDNNERFVLAVQWHPEMMAIKNELQQEIINKFVDSCKQLVSL